VSAERPKGQTTVVEPTAAERTVARRAAESRATIPHLELSVAGVGRLSDGLLLRGCALALAEHPRANAAYRDGRFELYSRINIGLVLALPQSYLVPTVFDADGKSLDELEDEAQALRSQAEEGRLAAPAFSGSTFTVWNAGSLGIAQASLPVVPPQAGALAAGTTELTLACDHRILYGAQAAAFLNAVRGRLEHPTA
jgi:pyruvate dehydrogenase E2 component (dihydrolipoamide acetyltransferase)